MAEEKFTLFFKRTVFSQWYPSKFTVDGVEYSCAEQYMMAQKALLFKDEDTYRKIMATKKPNEQKLLGRLVRDFDLELWNEKAKDIVYQGNMAKFSQSQHLKEALFATDGTTLVETNPHDPIWGIGLAEDHPHCHRRDLWRGTNWLGEVLTKVREDLIDTI
jgi:ribA/ribD-fused uncharacterized protein